MVNTLYLPEIREMLEEQDRDGLREFCVALHPARTAEFMEGLDASEAWRVLQHADEPLRQEIFNYFEPEKQVEILESQDRHKMADLVAELPPDDRVDVLDQVDPDVVAELMPLLPVEERRDILRLQSYPEDTAGAVMTTEFAKLGESMTVREALEELGRQAEELETIYYIYVVDEADHLRGVVSARQLVSRIGKPQMPLSDLMEARIVTATALEDQEEVARKVAKFDLLAIPVVDDQHRLIGIITHDDVIDVVREEATEDAHRIAAVDPLEVGYLRTAILTLAWKRAIWLTVLFLAALATAFALRFYSRVEDQIHWLVWFVPLIISSGGNSGSQSATLIITALATGDVELSDWFQIVWREWIMGLLLGSFLAAIGFLAAWWLIEDAHSAMIIPGTVMLVVICGTLTGSTLPLIFSRIGLDPALMSNPFVAGIIDILGIVIYMNVAAYWLGLTM